MEAKAVIIHGEAPESDDESMVIKGGVPFQTILAAGACGTVSMEGKDSDDDVNSIGSASYALDPSTCSYIETKGHKSERSCVKYNSLLHKKLRECNKSLDRNVKELLDTTITNAIEELSETNRQLLKSEIVLQETVQKYQTAMTQFEETVDSLTRIVDEDYLNTVKIHN